MYSPLDDKGSSQVSQPFFWFFANQADCHCVNVQALAEIGGDLELAQRKSMFLDKVPVARLQSFVIETERAELMLRKPTLDLEFPSSKEK